MKEQGQAFNELIYNEKEGLASVFIPIREKYSKKMKTRTKLFEARRRKKTVTLGSDYGGGELKENLWLGK